MKLGTTPKGTLVAFLDQLAADPDAYLKGVKRPKRTEMEKLFQRRRREAEARDVAPPADVLMRQADQAEAADAAALKGGSKR